MQKNKRTARTTHAFGTMGLSDAGHTIAIDIVCTYDATRSDPESKRFAFNYTVSIVNQGQAPVQLLHRSWHITDANNLERKMRGEQLEGEQPRLSPGERFVYSSHVTLETPVGSMCGAYTFCSEGGALFEADTPTFSLAKPDMVH